MVVFDFKNQMTQKKNSIQPINSYFSESKKKKKVLNSFGFSL